MDIDSFMESYKRAWETSDEHLLASLFAADGCYRNTPFACQQGHEAIKALLATHQTAERHPAAL